MLRTSALSALVIIALSLAVWTLVYVSGLRTLDTSETTVVVGFFTAMVLGGRWLVVRLCRRRGGSGQPIIAWWSIASLLAAPGSIDVLTMTVTASAAERDALGSPGLACTTDQPTAGSGNVVTLRAWWFSPLGTAPRYVWTANVGTLTAAADSARWTLGGVPPGHYRAEVRVTEAPGTSLECGVTVIVRGPDDVWRAGPEAGLAFLVTGQHETPGYGLYSYLLLGGAPDDTTNDRYLRVLDAYLRKMPHVSRLEEYFPPDQLNATYVPVTSVPVSPPNAKWLLEHYDFARARFLLRRLPGNLRRGPYFVSALRPLSVPGGEPREYLLQDLSSVPPHLVDSWVIAFLDQSSQERFWKTSAVRQLGLKMRTIIGVLSLGLPEVRGSLKDWIDVRN
jgi:hypothetical protein